MNWKLAAPLAVAALGVLQLQASAAVIADWTFETSQPASAGPFSPETGAGSATGSHVGASTYSTPAGNGSSHSFSSNTWGIGDYYQYHVSMTGMQGVSIQWDQTSSNTGPKDFQLAYSTDGLIFTSLGAGYSVLANAAPNAPWNATTGSSIYTFGPINGPSSLDNQADVYFRMSDADTVSANGGSVAPAGTDRMDNVIITASPASVPEPATAGLLIAGLGGMLIRRRRAN